jgi:hypothetical protein
MTAFTTPISWPTGLDVTESILNQQVRDNEINLDERATALEAVVGSRSAALSIVPDLSDVDTTGIKYLPIPAICDGMDLVRVKAFTITAGVTNPTTVQVRNMTAYPGNDALDTPMSIASGAVLSTGGVIDTDYDDVSTDDLLKVYVTGNSTTKPKGLYVILEFATP